MKNFTRALREALQYWHYIALATLCSVAIAGLWGGNIGALFPIIEVTFAGEPLQEWVAKEIGKAEVAIADCEQQISTLQAERVPSPERAVKIDQLKTRILAEQAAVAFAQRLRPWIDRYFPTDPFQTVLIIVAALFATTFIKHVFLLANTYLIANVSTRIARQIRLEVFDHALNMDRAGFSQYGSSGFSAHITHTTGTLATGITNVYGGAIREPLKLICCLTGACFICWRLVVLSLIVVPLAAFLVVWLSRKIKRVCRRLIQKAMQLHHVMLEAFANINTVQAYCMESTETKRFRGASNEIMRYSLKTTFLNAFTRPITELIGVGMICVTILVSAYLVLNQTTHFLGIPISDRPLTIPGMMVFFGLLIGATDPVRKLSTVLASINTGIVAADILYPMLDSVPRIVDPEDPQKLSGPVQTIDLKSVWFAYRDDDWVLRDATVRIQRGAKTAIVGPNGAGKSSLLNLLCRFYDTQRGHVELNGLDIREMAVADLRRRISLVTQQTELFNESIRYNICYGSQNATQEDIVAAARLARADQFITQKLEDGYETLVGQGGQRLSGGQRQRIALARAFLRNPEILILDEATSQIDAESELLIRDALEEFGRDRFILMVTHRSALLDRADQILEIQDGRIRELNRADGETRQAA